MFLGVVAAAIIETGQGIIFPSLEEVAIADSLISDWNVPAE